MLAIIAEGEVIKRGRHEIQKLFNEQIELFIVVASCIKKERLSDLDEWGGVFGCGLSE